MWEASPASRSRDRSDRLRKLSLLGGRGQGRASHQNFGYRAGGRTSEVTVTHSEPREEPVTRPSLRVRDGAARAVLGRHASRERGSAGRGCGGHRPAPQGGDPIAPAGAPGAHGPLARRPPPMYSSLLPKGRYVSDGRSEQGGYEDPAHSIANEGTERLSSRGRSSLPLLKSASGGRISPARRGTSSLPRG